MKLAFHTKHFIRRLIFLKTLTELLSFLGLCNVFGPFASSFAQIAAPLNHHLRKTHPETFVFLNSGELHFIETFEKGLLSITTNFDFTWLRRTTFTWHKRARRLCWQFLSTKEMDKRIKPFRENVALTKLLWQAIKHYSKQVLRECMICSTISDFSGMAQNCHTHLPWRIKVHSHGSRLLRPICTTETSFV